MAQLKLGELLVRASVLQDGQLRAALAEQQRWGGKLGETLVRMGFVTEELLVRALSKQLGLPVVNLESVEDVPAQVKARIPAATARDMGVLPLQLRDEGRTLVVVMSDPLNVQLQDDLRALTRCRLQVGLAGPTAIGRAYARFYGGQAAATEGDDAFPLVDSQGRAVRSTREAPRPAAPPPAAARPAPAQVPPSAPGADGPSQQLRTVEELQRREATALRATVELLIEKGVFTRDEYLAKVRR